MIQPISTLRDHQNAFRSEDENDPTQGINAAYAGIQKALENSKINLNDLLSQQPEAPEIDQQKVEQNKKMAQMGVVLQALDSIGTALTHRGEGTDPIMNTGRYDQLGLAALNNLTQMDAQHQVDLRNYNTRKDQVDQVNRELAMNVNRHNAGIDLQSAQIDLDREQAAAKAILSQKEQEKLESDQQAKRLYDAGLRLISQGQVEMAAEFFRDAGIENQRVDQLIQQYRNSTTTGGGSSESAQMSQLEELGLSQKHMILYEQMNAMRSRINPETDYVRDPLNGQVDYTKPLPNTPAADYEFLRKELGANYYLIDSMQANQPGRREYTPEMQRASIEMQNSPEVQQGRFQAFQTTQQTLAHGYLNPRSAEQRRRSKQSWLQNNAGILRNLGFNENEISELNEQMFQEMISEMGGSPSDQDVRQATPPQADPAPESTPAPMRATQRQVEEESVPISPIDQAFQDYQNSGGQIQSQQEDRLREMYGSDLNRVLNLLRREHPDRSDDFLKYLMLEKPDLAQVEPETIDMGPTIGEVFGDMGNSAMDLAQRIDQAIVNRYPKQRDLLNR